MLPLRTLRPVPLYLAVFFGTWAVLQLLSFDVRFLSRGLLQYSAGGVSHFKALTLVVWACVTSLVLAYYEYIPRRITGGGATLWLLFVTLSTSLVAHFVLCLQYGLSPYEKVVAYIGTEASTNHLIHLHVMKGLLWHLLSFLGVPDVRGGADPGQAFAELLPGWVFLAPALLVPASAVALLRAIPLLASQWGSSIRPAVLTAYVISSGSVLKTTIDGGLFANDVWAFGPALCALLLTSEPNIKLLLRRAALYQAVGAVSYMLLLQVLLPVEAFAAFDNYLLSVLFLYAVSVLVAGIAGTRRQIPLTVAGIALVALLFTFSGNTYWTWELRRLQTELSGRSRYFVLDLQNRLPYQTPRYQEGELRVHELFGVGLGNTVYRVHRALGIPTGYADVLVDRAHCNAAQPYASVGYVIPISGRYQPIPNPNSPIRQLEYEPCQGTACRAPFAAAIAGCVPNEAFQIVAHHFAHAGLERFLLVEPRRHTLLP